MHNKDRLYYIRGLMIINVNNMKKLSKHIWYQMSTFSGQHFFTLSFGSCNVGEYCVQNQVEFYNWVKIIFFVRRCYKVLPSWTGTPLSMGLTLSCPWEHLNTSNMFCQWKKSQVKCPELSDWNEKCPTSAVADTVYFFIATLFTYPRYMGLRT